MSSFYTSEKLKTLTIKSFRDSLKDVSPEKIGYIFLSKTSQYPDENVVTNLSDTTLDEKKIWDEMIIAKRILSKDVEFVIPRYNWEPGRRYKQYDDTIPLKDLLEMSMDGNVPVYPMYVMNADGDVYKCLSNAVNEPSQTEPTGNFTTNNGFIRTENGNDTFYLWKYMYNVKNYSKFLTNDWMPVPFIEANSDYTIYTYSANSTIEGTINEIVLTNRGTNYYHTNVNVQSFTANTRELLITDDINLPTTNTINVNMLVTGTGLNSNKIYISQIDPAKPKTLILSDKTTSAGGGSNTANIITISTRVSVIGDGNNVTSSVDLFANNVIRKINVINSGNNYTRANVIIYGSVNSSNATARVILPPPFGHGYNPALELGATNLMIISRIGEVDATENNQIPVNVDFRQYGLLIDPYKYGENEAMTPNNALDVVSQTTDVTLISPSSFVIGETVYQGNTSNPTFTGSVVSQSSNIVKLNNTYKQPVPGLNLIGLQSGTPNPVVSVSNPDLKKYTGDVLFARNILKVQRNISQAEEVKLVFQF